MRSNRKIALFSIGFVICLGIFLYPVISSIWNAHVHSKIVKDYDDYVETMDREEVDKMWEEAKVYNENYGNEDKLKELGLSYDSVLNPRGNGMMGYLTIPKIREEIQICHSLDEEVLQKAVGHMPETALPIGTKGTRSVLAGHTGLAKAKLLTNLDQLETGDVFYIKILDKSMIYQVVHKEVVLPTEVNRLTIVEDEALVTLVTCTPYGINSHRLLVTGRLIGEGEIQDLMADSNTSELDFINPIYVVSIEVVVAGFIALITYLIRMFLKKRGVLHEKKSE